MMYCRKNLLEVTICKDCAKSSQTISVASLRWLVLKECAPASTSVLGEVRFLGARQQRSYSLTSPRYSCI